MKDKLFQRTGQPTCARTWTGVSSKKDISSGSNFALVHLGPWIGLWSPIDPSSKQSMGNLVYVCVASTPSRADLSTWCESSLATLLVLYTALHWLYRKLNIYCQWRETLLAVLKYVGSSKYKHNKRNFTTYWVLIYWEHHCYLCKLEESVIEM